MARGPLPVLAGALVVIAATGVAWTRARADWSAADEALLPHGQAVYRVNCASCHGLTGDGKGPAARYLDPLPRDFQRGEYKFRTTPSGSAPTDADLLRTIRTGVPGTAMPAWAGKLSEPDLRAVVAYIKSFSSRFKEETVDPADILKIPPAPPPTKESIAEGRVIYRLMKCWECHGPTARGDGPAVPTLKDGFGRKIRPFDFTSGRYRGGSGPGDVYRTFSTGLDGTPMPAFVEALLIGKEAFDDVTALEKYFSAPEVAEVKLYGLKVPTFEELGALDEAAQRSVMERNRWALVFYVKSLARKRGPLEYLFADPAGRLDDPLF